MEHKSVVSTSASSRDSQYGGTIMGFLIGGVVGLLAALIVAVFVTKVPVPFVNKTLNRNAEQDQAEAAKNKNWDPNAALTGKAVAPKPPAEASGAVTAASVPAPAPGATTSPAPAASTANASEKTAEKAPSKPPADPLGDLVKQKMYAPEAAANKPLSPTAPAATTAPAAAGAQPGVLAPKPPAATAPAAAQESATNAFFVQAGAYSNAGDAEAQRGKIALSGLEAKVSEREVSGRTVYRVRVGPIDKKPDADKIRERLEGMGYDARVMTVSR